LNTFNWGIALGIMGFVFIGLTLLRGRNDSLKRMPYFISIGTTGFSTMLLQIVLILAFQSAYGYVYYKIGLIFASFMLGIAGGSFAAANPAINDARLAKSYFNVQAALCAYCLLLPVVFRLNWVSEGLFLLLPAAAGLLGGLQFTMANRICSGGNNRNPAPAIYAVDLIGACAGSLITAAVIIPIKGMDFACISVGFVNLAVLVLLAGRDQFFLSKT
jgi:spermidine synthase